MKVRFFVDVLIGRVTHAAGTSAEVAEDLGRRLARRGLVAADAPGGEPGAAAGADAPDAVADAGAGDAGAGDGDAGGPARRRRR